jgi:hypothetical protein
MGPSRASMALGQSRRPRLLGGLHHLKAMQRDARLRPRATVQPGRPTPADPQEHVCVTAGEATTPDLSA